MEDVMYFSMKRHKEITQKAKELGYYYTAEFATGYMMTHHFWEFIADFFIVGIPIGLILLICVRWLSMSNMSIFAPIYCNICKDIHEHFLPNAGLALCILEHRAKADD